MRRELFQQSTMNLTDGSNYRRNTKRINSSWRRWLLYSFQIISRIGKTLNIIRRGFLIDILSYLAIQFNRNI